MGNTTRDITERIDEMCEERFGHTHWACVDTLSDQEKMHLDERAEIVTVEGQQVALYIPMVQVTCTVQCWNDEGETQDFYVKFQTASDTPMAKIQESIQTIAELDSGLEAGLPDEEDVEIEPIALDIRA
jgi:hypothetical protein